MYFVDSGLLSSGCTLELRLFFLSVSYDHLNLRNSKLFLVKRRGRLGMMNTSLMFEQYLNSPT